MIDRGRKSAPYAFVIPRNQRHAAEAADMVNLFRAQGAEVHVATSDFALQTKAAASARSTDSVTPAVTPPTTTPSTPPRDGCPCDGSRGRPGSFVWINRTRRRFARCNAISEVQGATRFPFPPAVRTDTGSGRSTHCVTSKPSRRRIRRSSAGRCSFSPRMHR